MAKHIHVSFTCDRCKADLGDKPPVRSQKSQVAANFNWTEGHGPSFSWVDLCDPCDAAVRAFFLPEPLDLRPTADDRREARVWWAKVAAYVNEEAAEYIMVRARRIIGERKP